MPPQGFQRLEGPTDTKGSMVRTESYDLKSSQMHEDEETETKPKYGPTDLRYILFELLGGILAPMLMYPGVHWANAMST